MENQSRINCRLCDRDITRKNRLLLYDYNENVETKLGKKINIILNCNDKSENLSNYCCEFCSCKIEICFNLLVEIQASNEVIKQTYKHLSNGEKVDTENQSFICGECKATISGIKLFIKHYENHIFKKTITTCHKDISLFKYASKLKEEGLVNNILPENSTKNCSRETDLKEVNSEFSNNSKTEVFFRENAKKVNSLNIKKDVICDVNFSSTEDIDDYDRSTNVTDPDSLVDGYENEENDIQNEFENVNYSSGFITPDSHNSDAESFSSFLSDSSYNCLVSAVKQELEKSDSEDESYNVNPNENGRYDCETCKLSFEYKFLLKIHLRKNHKTLHEFDVINLREQMKILEYESNKFIKCLYCKKSFLSIEFKGHILECKEQYSCEKNILCQICGKMYSSRNWEKHLEEHKKLDGWTCELCGKKFKAKRFLKSHLGEHDESKKKMCEICGKKVLALSFFSHVMKHREKRHVCQYCGKAFTYNYGLRIHLKIHDTNKKVESKLEKKKNKVFCWLCKKDFGCIIALNKHLKNDHNAETEQDTRFPCSHCDKKFADMFSLKAHLKLIHEMKDEDVSRLKSLPIYRYIECNVCKRVFNSENKIRIHMKKDHGLKPFEMEILKKECEKCGKKFASKQNLIHHINGAHLNIKPMTCDICQEKFAKHSSLIYHKLRHSGEKPFQCEFCKKSYRQRNDVIRHLARHVRDKELTLEEASAVNNSPSRLVLKRRIFLKDSSINYQTIVKRSRRKSEVVEMEPILEEEINEVQEEQMEFGEDVISESMIYVEEVHADENQQSSSDVHYINTKPVYNEERNTIILSSPDVLKNSVKNVTYRYIPSQLKHMPAVIVKKQEQI